MASNGIYGVSKQFGHGAELYAPNVADDHVMVAGRMQILDAFLPKVTNKDLLLLFDYFSEIRKKLSLRFYSRMVSPMI